MAETAMDISGSMLALTEAQTVATREAMEVICTEDANRFVFDLIKRYRNSVESLLKRRANMQERLNQGATLQFLEETRDIREAHWTVSELPQDLLDRRVEITGPAQRKMILNALNSGAKVFMADFEDSMSPTWSNIVQGQHDLYEAVRRTIQYKDPNTSKEYALNEKTATLMVRPRGWHLREKHALMQGNPVSAALFDFGFFVYHNAAYLKEKGSGAYFYLPKMQSHLEARLWNDIFSHTELTFGLPRGTIKATVLIETLPAAFEMDEILFELRHHSAGLNCGRWDYMFSCIKTYQGHKNLVFPDREQVTMEQPFMRAYTQLLVQTCHKRNVHAMGGMAAQIPIKNDEEANERALEKVRKDKLREVNDGHDGTWVAHPALVPIAMEIFDKYMPSANQLVRQRDDLVITESQLQPTPTGMNTESGLRHSIRVAIQYITAWLDGNGCVPLYNLMEDAATAEICRTQIWQWLHHQVKLDDNKPLTMQRFDTVLKSEIAELSKTLSQTESFQKACELFEKFCKSEQLDDFLTIEAYALLA